MKKFHDCGAEVHAVVGFKNKDLVILEDKFRAASSVLKLMTDDGSYGEKVLSPMRSRSSSTRATSMTRSSPSACHHDEIRVQDHRAYGIPTTVSMSPIMVDGTGMCGGCRLTVGGETKFACVDGPDFDGHKVDWDESLKRGKMYFDWERHKYEETCNLFSKEVQ